MEEVTKPQQQAIDPSFLNVIREKSELSLKLAGIKHKIGVYSAKGGVGKTTVAVNLAYALSSMGYKIGLLDADIDTPNITFFIGDESRAEGKYPIKPIERYGVKVLSTSMFLDDSKKPIIWRGPLIVKMLKEFLMNTDWGDLDYLVIDLPPGTSDVPLSILQLLSLDGFIIVTTPQHISAINAIKSGRMIKRLGASILGVVENMSGAEVKGAKEVAEALDCELLGAIRTDAKFDELSDAGKIPVLSDNRLKEVFINIAKKLVK